MLLLRLEKMRYAMSEYHIGGGLRLLTALEKTEQFAAFLKTRMTPALETQDPTELHYRMSCAITHAHNAGFIERVERNVWSLTQRGS